MTLTTVLQLACLALGTILILRVVWSLGHDAGTAEARRLHREACNARAVGQWLRTCAEEKDSDADRKYAAATYALCEAGALVSAGLALSIASIHRGTLGPGIMNEGPPGKGELMWEAKAGTNPGED